jgi:hypothetical protein
MQPKNIARGDGGKAIILRRVSGKGDLAAPPVGGEHAKQQALAKVHELI